MQRQRPGHRILSFHHRGLLLLAAAVAVMLFFLYGCVAGAAYSPGGGWCSSLSHRFREACSSLEIASKRKPAALQGNRAAGCFYRNFQK